MPPWRLCTDGTQYLLWEFSILVLRFRNTWCWKNTQCHGLNMVSWNNWSLIKPLKTHQRLYVVAVATSSLAVAGLTSGLMCEKWHSQFLCPLNCRSESLASTTLTKQTRVVQTSQLDDLTTSQWHLVAHAFGERRRQRHWQQMSECNEISPEH